MTPNLGKGKASAFPSARCYSHRSGHPGHPIRARALSRPEVLHTDQLCHLCVQQQRTNACAGAKFTVLFRVVQFDIGQVERDVPICVKERVLRKVHCCKLRCGRKAARVELALDEGKKNSWPHRDIPSLSFQAIGGVSRGYDKGVARPLACLSGGRRHAAMRLTIVVLANPPFTTNGWNGLRQRLKNATKSSHSLVSEQTPSGVEQIVRPASMLNAIKSGLSGQAWQSQQ